MKKLLLMAVVMLMAGTAGATEKISEESAAATQTLNVYITSNSVTNDTYYYLGDKYMGQLKNGQNTITAEVGTRLFIRVVFSCYHLLEATVSGSAGNYHFTSNDGLIYESVYYTIPDVPNQAIYIDGNCLD